MGLRHTAPPRYNDTDKLRSCYKVDKKTGLSAIANTLRPLGLNQTTPATGPAGTASHIVFSEDGKQLIASVKGVPPTPGFLAIWDVNADGSLSPDFKNVAPAKDGLLPFSMTVIPGKNAILATDAGLGFDIFDLKDNNRSSAIAIDGQVATCWSSFSKKTGNFYLTDIGTATVTEVHVDDNLKGSIVQQYPQAPGSATIDNDIATVNGQECVPLLFRSRVRVADLRFTASCTSWRPTRLRSTFSSSTALERPRSSLRSTSLDPPRLRGSPSVCLNFVHISSDRLTNCASDPDNLQGMTVFTS